MIHDNETWLKWISEIQALVQSGLAYSKNEYDIERYIRLREMVSELAAHCSDQDVDEIKNIFTIEAGYATPALEHTRLTTASRSIAK